MGKFFTTKKIALYISLIGLIIFSIHIFSIFSSKDYSAEYVKKMVGYLLIFIFGFTIYTSYGKSLISRIGVGVSVLGFIVSASLLWMPETFKATKPLVFILPAIAILLAVMNQLNQLTSKIVKVVNAFVVLFGVVLSYACLVDNMTSTIYVFLTVLFILISISGTLLVVNHGKKTK